MAPVTEANEATTLDNLCVVAVEVLEVEEEYAAKAF